MGGHLEVLPDEKVAGQKVVLLLLLSLVSGRDRRAEDFKEEVLNVWEGVIQFVSAVDQCKNYLLNLLGALLCNELFKGFLCCAGIVSVAELVEECLVVLLLGC